LIKFREYGFNRTPFGRDLAPGMLHRHASHNEAVARISWCISERSIGVVTGEVGAGKTVSVRTVLAGLDPSKHTVIYLPTRSSASEASTRRSSRRSGKPHPTSDLG
jgi:type II secretory pathway predicted ATPase ExeA